MKLFKIKFFALLIMSLALTVKLTASNYYFSSSMGNDANTSAQAQNTLTPWQTLTKLNSIMSLLLPGDSVLFKCGDTFYGSFTVTTSGALGSPIVFSSYGVGAKPIITGLTTLTNWTAQGTNIWEANCPNCGSSVNLLLLNGASKPLGRYPNITDPNNGYLTFEAYGASSITDNQLTSSPNWNGAELVVRTSRFRLDKRVIQSHSGNTLNYLGSTLPIYSPNFGYFMQNHPQTLDVYGEWCYNSNTKKIQLYTNANNPSTSNVQAATKNNLIYVVYQNYITINGLEFDGGNDYTLYFNYANYVSITNCKLNFSGTDGIYGLNSSNFLVEKDTLINTNNIAVALNVSNNSFIKNNVIKNTGTEPGMVVFDDYVGVLCGISIYGKHNLIEYNEIDSTGYIPIIFSGDSVLVKNNYISNFNFILDDGGGIYTGGNNYINRVIEGNIILNGIGASKGTDDTSSTSANGIYLDENSKNVKVINNTTANCSLNGIFLHNAGNNVIRQNTSFNNGVQLCFEGSGSTLTTDTIKNNSTYNNILFSKQVNQLVSRMAADAMNDINNYGRFDTNYYCRPVNEEGVISANSSDENRLNLVQWKTNYNKDSNSVITPLQIPTYSINTLLGINKFSNGTFNSTINGLYCIGTNCAVSWDNSGMLDGGCLKYSFTSVTTGSLNGSILAINIGAVNITKKYILKFSLKGTKNNQTMVFNLRQAGPNYLNLSPFQYCKISTNRTENEFLLEPTITENNSILQFFITEDDSTLWLDNIELYEANVTMTNLDDYIRFEYNATQQPKTIPLINEYIDVKSNYYITSLTLQPFTSVVLLKLPSTVPNGIKDYQALRYDDVTIYPNPTATTLNLKATLQDLSKIIIYDVTGRKILEVNYSEQIDLSPLNNGIYILRVTNKNDRTVCSKKIIIQK